MDPPDADPQHPCYPNITFYVDSVTEKLLYAPCKAEIVDRISSCSIDVLNDGVEFLSCARSYSLSFMYPTSQLQNLHATFKQRKCFVNWTSTFFILDSQENSNELRLIGWFVYLKSSKSASKRVCRTAYFGDRINPKSIEWFREDQAFSPSYDLAPPPPPLPSVSSTGDILEEYERETTCWRERGNRVKEESNHTTARKPGPP